MFIGITLTFSQVCARMSVLQVSAAALQLGQYCAVVSVPFCKMQVTQCVSLKSRDILFCIWVYSCASFISLIIFAVKPPPLLRVMHWVQIRRSSQWHLLRNGYSRNQRLRMTRSWQHFLRSTICRLLQRFHQNQLSLLELLKRYAEPSHATVDWSLWLKDSKLQ